MNVTFTAEIDISERELDATRSLVQAIQNRIGSSGAVVTSVNDVESTLPRPESRAR